MTDLGGIMPCPHGCAWHLAPGEPCPGCGHQLTVAEQRRLAHRAHVRHTIAQVRADWEQWKTDHPRTTTTTRRPA